ncbi:hypothetical protein ACFV20_00010 [Streptomyces sp. NPDC059696]|uniref:hypothetical protein n=1 Tax=Streptomyces sp. NPDC059696 TaxID=3346911 RepID=UPI003684BE0A
MPRRAAVHDAPLAEQTAGLPAGRVLGRSRPGVGERFGVAEMAWVVWVVWVV